MANKETTVRNKKRRAALWKLWADKRRVKNARRIVALRNRLGLSQQQLADACSEAGSCRITVRTVQGWEQGHKPTGKNAKIVAHLEGSSK